MRYFVKLAAGEELAVDVVRKPNGRLDVSVDGTSVTVDAVDVGGALNVRVGERVFDLWLDGDNEGDLHFTTGNMRNKAHIESERSRVGASDSSGSASGGKVLAPMPGRVVKVLVAEGDEVQAGMPVIVVEAMKMENELCAEQPGVVSKICVSEGDSVDGGAPLIELAPLDADADGK